VLSHHGAAFPDAGEQGSVSLPGKPLVFLSYCRADGLAFATDLSGELRHNGIDCWMDRTDVLAGASWGRDIEEAIDRCEILIAILTRRAFTSDLCRAEQLRALRNGKRIIPILVHTDADRPLHLEHLHHANMTGEGSQTDDLQELIRRIREEQWTPVPSRFAITYLTVSAVPPHFQPRTDVIETMRRTIVSDNPRASIGTTVIWGMGGAGKTVLAQALCRDAVIQAAFPDGVVWTSIGRGTIEPIDQIRESLKALGEKVASFVNLTDATNRLRGVIRNKACLIVLDDVWDVRSVDAFRVEAPRSQILITARDGSLPATLGAAQYRLNEFAPAEALEFLASWAGSSVDALPRECATLAEECGRLPFALALCGAMKQNGVSWADLLGALRAGDLAYLENQLPGFQHANVLRCLQVSVDALEAVDPQAVQRYKDLVVFRKDSPIPEGTIVSFWTFESAYQPRDARKLLVQLDRRALLRIEDSASGRVVTFHDLLVDYLQAITKDPTPLHLRLTEMYRKACGGNWAQGVDDGYFCANLSWHLSELRASRLLYELVSRQWMEKQFRRVDSHRSFLVDLSYVIGAAFAERNPFQLMGALLLNSLFSAAAPGIPEALEALVYLGQTKRAMDRASVIQDPDMRSRAYQSIAKALAIDGQTERLRSAVDEARHAAASIASPDQRSLALSRIAEILLDYGDFESARPIAKEAASQAVLSPVGHETKTWLHEYLRPSVLMRAAEILQRVPGEDQWGEVAADALRSAESSPEAARILAVRMRGVALMRRAGYEQHVKHDIPKMLDLLAKAASEDDKWLAIGDRGVFFDALIDSGQVDQVFDWAGRLIPQGSQLERAALLAKTGEALFRDDPDRALKVMREAQEAFAATPAEERSANSGVNSGTTAAQAISRALARAGKIDEALRFAEDQSLVPAVRRSALVGLVAEYAASHTDDAEAQAITNSLLEDPEPESFFVTEPEIMAGLIAPLVDMNRLAEAQLVAGRLIKMVSSLTQRHSSLQGLPALCGGLVFLGKEERALQICAAQANERTRVSALKQIARAMIRQGDTARASWAARVAADQAEAIAETNYKGFELVGIAPLLLNTGQLEFAVGFAQRGLSWVSTTSADYLESIVMEFAQVYSAARQFTEAQSAIDLLSAKNTALSLQLKVEALKALAEAYLADGVMSRAMAVVLEMRATADAVAEKNKISWDDLDAKALLEAARAYRMTGQQDAMQETADRAFEIAAEKLRWNVRYYENPVWAATGHLGMLLAHGHARSAAETLINIDALLGTRSNLAEWISEEAAAIIDPEHRSGLLSKVAAAYLHVGDVETGASLFALALHAARPLTTEHILKLVRNIQAGDPLPKSCSAFLSLLALAILAVGKW